MSEIQSGYVLAKPTRSKGQVIARPLCCCEIFSEKNTVSVMLLEFLVFSLR